VSEERIAAANGGINMTIKRFSRADMKFFCPEKSNSFFRKVHYYQLRTTGN